MRPITCATPRRQIQKDPTVHRDYQPKMSGWSKPSEDDRSYAVLYSTQRDHNCPMMSHMGNSGLHAPKNTRVSTRSFTFCTPIAKMKALTRSYVWWPEIDNEIDDKSLLELCGNEK